MFVSVKWIHSKQLGTLPDMEQTLRRHLLNILYPPVPVLACLPQSSQGPLCSPASLTPILIRSVFYP